MSAIYVLVALALVILAAGIGAYVWAVRRGQYDDLETPALRMLHDDVPRAEEGDGPGQHPRRP